MNPPDLSQHLQRLLGEALGADLAEQAERFLLACLAEGLDDDTIVVLARQHKPTSVRYETEYSNVPDRGVEKALSRLRADAPAQTAIGFLDWNVEFTLTHTEPSYCIPGLIEQGDSVSLTGTAKVGKSLLALEAAACKATGIEFLGQECRPAPVLYLDYENRKEMVVRRRNGTALRRGDRGRRVPTSATRPFRRRSPCRA